jgi:hypothetical protein
MASPRCVFKKTIQPSAARRARVRGKTAVWGSGELICVLARPEVRVTLRFSRHDYPTTRYHHQVDCIHSPLYQRKSSRWAEIRICAYQPIRDLNAVSRAYIVPSPLFPPFDSSHNDSWTCPGIFWDPYQSWSGVLLVNPQLRRNSRRTPNLLSLFTKGLNYQPRISSSLWISQKHTAPALIRIPKYSGAGPAIIVWRIKRRKQRAGNDIGSGYSIKISNGLISAYANFCSTRRLSLI